MAASLLPFPTTLAPGRFKLPEPHAQLPLAQRQKDKVSGRYDEAISYSMPGKDGISRGPDDGEIYDDTAVLAAPEFASRIQQGVIPNFSRWASFVAGIMIEDEEQLTELEAALQKVDEYLFHLINSSSFMVEANECFMDIGIGTACINIRESSGTNPFNCRSVPLRGLNFLNGPDGLPDPIWESRVTYPHLLKVLYPEAHLPEGFATYDPNCELEVVECWQRDWSQPTEMVWRQSVYLPALQNVVILEEWHEDEGACEYIVFRWSKSSGEAWGRGPLFNCLPSMRKVNYAERALLDHTDLSLGGIWTVEDDGVFNVDTVRLEPGTLVPRAPGSQPLQNVAPAGNFEIAQFTLTEARETIKRALFTEQLGNPNKTPMSATEVTQRMTELARAIGSPFARLILEFAMPSVVRFTRICKDRKLIRMPTVNGKQIKLMCTSPLAQAQRFEDIDAIDRYLAMLGARLGTDMLNIVVDGSATADELADKFQVPKRINRSKAEQEQIIKAISGAVSGQGSANEEAMGGGAGDGAGAGAPAPELGAPA